MALTGGLLVGTWGLFVVVGNSWWQLFVAVLLAFVFTKLGFLGHDAGHRQMSPAGCKMPATLDSAQEAIAIALSCLGLDRAEDARVVRIKNTLQIAEVDVSECLLPEVAKRDDLSQVGDAAALAFDAAGFLQPF